MPKLYEYELGKAALILTKELFKLKEGETFLITADTESDERVVDATASAAFALGAKPIVTWIPRLWGWAKQQIVCSPWMLLPLCSLRWTPG